MSEMSPTLVVQSSMYFLKRAALYNTEKVYEIRSNDFPTVPRTNMLLEKVDGIPIRNVRGEHCSLETHGFFCLRLDSTLVAEDFQQQSNITGIYLPQLTRAIEASLNANRIQIYDYTVCLLSKHRLGLISGRSVNDNSVSPSVTVPSMSTNNRPAWCILVYSTHRPLSLSLLDGCSR